MTTPGSLQILAAEIRAVAPIAFAVLASVLLVAVVAFIAAWVEAARWRRNLAHHLPAITREQLRLRDEKIRELSRRCEALDAENESLAVAVRGARACLDLPRQEAQGLRVACEK